MPAESGSNRGPETGAFFQRDQTWHPPALTPNYKTSVLRSPQKAPLAFDNTLSEIAGPVFGHAMLGELDADLIHNFARPGESAIGETLQAVGRHRFAEPLLAPGELDLTAHVDFQALAEAAEGMGARVHGLVTQALLLRRLGIEQRAAALKAAAPPHYAATIEAALARLTSEDRTGMGRLIKAIAIASPNLSELPGFET